MASALLEHIGAVARERGIRRFAAEVLPANTKMIKVFTDAGYTQKRSFDDGVVRLEFDLEPTDRSLAVMRAREQRAEARSVQRLLAPGSVAVIGTGRAPGGVGRTVLRNLLDGGFTGRVHAVNHAFPEDWTRLDPDGVRPTAPCARSTDRSTWPSSPCPPRRCPPWSPTAANTASRGSSSSPPDTPRAARRAATASATWSARPAPTACASSAPTPSASSTPPRAYG